MTNWHCQENTREWSSFTSLHAGLLLLYLLDRLNASWFHWVNVPPDCDNKKLNSQIRRKYPRLSDLLYLFKRKVTYLLELIFYTLLMFTQSFNHVLSLELYCLMLTNNILYIITSLKIFISYKYYQKLYFMYIKIIEFALIYSFLRSNYFLFSVYLNLVIVINEFSLNLYQFLFFN